MNIVRRIRRLLGRDKRAEYYGIRDVSGTLEGKLETGDHVPAGSVVSRLGLPRCESRKREGSRSWRCTLHAGHETSRSVATDELIWPLHVNIPARRSWS